MGRLRFLFSLVFIMTLSHSPSFAQLEFNKVQLHFCQRGVVFFNLDIRLDDEDLRSIGIKLHPSQNEGVKNVLEFYTNVCGNKMRSSNETDENELVRLFNFFLISAGKIGKVANVDRIANWVFKIITEGRILNMPGEGLVNLADNDVLITYPLGEKVYAGFIDRGTLEPIWISILSRVDFSKNAEWVRDRYGIGIIPLTGPKFEREWQNLECLALGKGMFFIFIPIVIIAIVARWLIKKPKKRKVGVGFDKVQAE